jgi:hypothetical protein
MSILIDESEHRDIATADVAGVYLHADMEDFTLLRMDGELVDIMCSVCQEYSRFVVYEHGKKVLYLELLKALYGCVKSTLLWYNLFFSMLEGMGFKLNPYNTCFANKLIDGKQCTLVWYVDNTKISHMYMFMSHDHVPELSIKVTLQRFCKTIRQHLFGQAILYFYVRKAELVLD